MRRRGREKERTGERRMEGEGRERGKEEEWRKRWWRWIGGKRDRERGRGELG